MRYAIYNTSIPYMANDGSNDSANSEQYSAIPLNYSAAPRSAATASSQLSGWEASKVIDGDINTTWSSIYYSFDNRFANEWIKIDTGGLRGLKRVTVTPRQPQEYCYNGDFYLEVSPDETNWVKPDYDFREYRLRTTYNKYVFDFKDTIYARYVRLTSNSLYFDQNYSCYFQIGEIDIEQVTLSATASSTLNSDWAVTNILDDVVSRCWSSQYSASENSTEWVYIDTGTTRQISGVRC